MSIEKTASLIGVTVIGVLLAVVIWSREDRPNDDMELDSPRGGEGARANVGEVLDFGRRQKGSGEGVDFEGARAGRYATPRAKPQREEPSEGGERDAESERRGGEPRGESALASVEVLPGDSFSKIAERVYGDARRYLDILKANPGVDPRRLRAGQIIRLPASGRGEERAAEGRRPETSETAGHTHVVKRRETLSSISKRYYATTTRWRKILAANRGKISRPKDLRPGMRLNIPE